MSSTTKVKGEEVTIRSFDWKRDGARIGELERKCEADSTESPFIFTDTMGDPLCRIRNSPVYEMLVAELGDELVGIVGGSIKTVTVSTSTPKDCAKVGYVLGLRVSPRFRRRGIGLSLVRRLEEWFVANLVDYAYMATADNEASIKLFTGKLGFVKFRTPTILVNPVGQHSVHISSNVEIKKLEIAQAEHLYRKFMGSIEFFPQDIDSILMNRLSLGTWVAYPRGESWDGLRGLGGRPNPTSWAMLSVWNCGEVFKLRVGRVPMACVLFTKALRLMDRLLPCLRVPVLPDVFSAFGFYFMYGMHGEGPEAMLLLRSLCHYVHNMATMCKDCKVIVTEVGGCDALRVHIPHWKFLSCPEDLWCIKALSRGKVPLLDWIKVPPPSSLFVDPREV